MKFSHYTLMISFIAISICGMESQQKINQLQMLINGQSFIEFIKKDPQLRQYTLEHAMIAKKECKVEYAGSQLLQYANMAPTALSICSLVYASIPFNTVLVTMTSIATAFNGGFAAYFMYKTVNLNNKRYKWKRIEKYLAPDSEYMAINVEETAQHSDSQWHIEIDDFLWKHLKCIHFLNDIQNTNTTPNIVLEFNI